MGGTPQAATRDRARTVTWRPAARDIVGYRQEKRPLGVPSFDGWMAMMEL
jgi:hypothetical protein